MRHNHCQVPRATRHVPSARFQVQSAKCQVPSAKYQVQEHKRPETDPNAGASMVCPGGHGRIATQPKKGNPPRLGIWRQSRARSQALQARRSSRTPPRSNVHHEIWVLGVRWAARGRRSHASQSLPSAKCQVTSDKCKVQKHTRPETDPIAGASMVCPGEHGRIATQPKKANPPRPGIWRQSRARSQALQARRSSRTPPRSNVHHEIWVLGVRWAARGRRSHASQSLPSATSHAPRAKCKVPSAKC